MTTAESFKYRLPKCGRCGTQIKGPTASICEVCQESLWVTGVGVFGGGAGGGSGDKPISEDKQ